MSCSVNYQSGGSILPSHFVMANSTTDLQVVTADSNHPILGISQMGTNNYPAPSQSSPYAAISGQIIGVFQDEENTECLLALGGTVTGGAMLCSNSIGEGINFILSQNTAQYIGAEARQSGISGGLIRVRPRLNIVGRMT